MYPYFVPKLQALAAHAKVSAHPISLSLVAKYEDEDFVCILCKLCHGNFNNRSSGWVCGILDVASVSVVVCNIVLPRAKHVAFLLLRSASPAAMLLKQGLAAGVCHRDVSGDVVWLTDRAGGPKIRLGGFQDSEVCNPGKHHD